MGGWCCLQYRVPRFTLFLFRFFKSRRKLRAFVLSNLSMRFF
uniref:Uncharacterized protein n=1 Tax=Arundo donax TaxID=35708 RepID=A0A0A9AU00_ARUDO